jgi:signal transduction histidine kinase
MDLASAGALLALVAVTAALLARRPQHPVTLVLTVWVASSLLGLTPLGERYPNALWTLGPPLLAVLLVVFPDGPRGRAWRWALRYQVAVLVGFVLLDVAFPAGHRPAPVPAVALAAFIPIAAAAVVSLVRLWRRSAGPRRVRIGVVLAAGAVLVMPYVVVAPVVALLGGSSPVADVIGNQTATLSFALVPLAIGVAVLMEPRGRSAPVVDLLLPWALAVAGGMVVGGTAANVTAAAVGADSGDPVPPAVVAAASVSVALLAVAAMIVIRRGEALVPSGEERAASGLRSLAARLAQVLAPEEVPRVVAAAVGEALELRGVAVLMLRDGRADVLAEWGDWAGSEIVRPLEHAGETVGRLVLYPHPDGVPVDLAALQEILPAVAAAVAATRATDSLRLAHARLTGIRDAERHRLRDDLHDELSPALSGLRLAATAARDRLTEGKADAAADLLGRIEVEAGRAAIVVRGILADLRPDDVVEAGLVPAIPARVMSFHRPGTFEVEVHAEEPGPVLDPAVEVAAYRVATEAVANAAQHSGGTHCQVVVSGRGDDLVVEVLDDGAGLRGTSRQGVGLRSMAARAAAAGGVLSIETVEPTGTAVRVLFPAPVLASPPLVDAAGDPVRES